MKYIVVLLLSLMWTIPSVAASTAPTGFLPDQIVCAICDNMPAAESHTKALLSEQWYPAAAADAASFTNDNAHETSTCPTAYVAREKERCPGLLTTA